MRNHESTKGRKHETEKIAARFWSPAEARALDQRIADIPSHSAGLPTACFCIRKNEPVPGRERLQLKVAEGVELGLVFLCITGLPGEGRLWFFAERCVGRLWEPDLKCCCGMFPRGGLPQTVP